MLYNPHLPINNTWTLEMEAYLNTHLTWLRTHEVFYNQTANVIADRMNARFDYLVCPLTKNSILGKVGRMRQARLKLLAAKR